MNTKIKLLLMIFFVVQLSCTTKDIEKYDIGPILNAKIKLAESSDQPVKLDFCDSTSFNWDKIIILPPYSNKEYIRYYKLANSKSIEKLLPGLTLDEGICIFLFVEKDMIVKYSSVPRIPLDFNDLKNQDESIMILYRQIACNQLYIQRNNDKLALIIK